MPDQPTPAPTKKVGAAALGGALATIAVGVAKACGVELDPVFAASLGTVFAFAAGYFTSEP